MFISDFHGCPRAYHSPCLGVDEPEENEDWICPWHCCAVCSVLEDEAMSSLSVKPWPMVQNLRRTVVVEQGESLDLVHKPEHSSFMHCMTCSLALCGEHKTQSRMLVTEQGDMIEPLALLRPESKHGFFKCGYCCTQLSTKDGKCCGEYEKGG